MAQSEEIAKKDSKPRERDYGDWFAKWWKAAGEKAKQKKADSTSVNSAKRDAA